MTDWDRTAPGAESATQVTDPTLRAAFCEIAHRSGAHVCAVIRAVATIIETCRELRGQMVTFGKSPMLALNPRGKRAFELVELLLNQLEDVFDRQDQAEARLEYLERQAQLLDRDLTVVQQARG